MDDEKQIISDALDKFNQSIKDALISKGIQNTGSAAKSLKVVDSGEKMQSVGNDYIELLDKGRWPGKFAPVENIRDWVQTKLGITQEEEIESVAFLVNSKIAEKGTEIYRDNSQGLQIDEKIEKLKEDLSGSFSEYAIRDVKRVLDKFKSKKI